MCRFKCAKVFCTLLWTSGFNTSYVSVQDKALAKFLSYVGVSIHPMCRFKFIQGGIMARLKGFQYILCVGSSQLMLRSLILTHGFNTSYVSVQDASKITLEALY